MVSQGRLGSGSRILASSLGETTRTSVQERPCGPYSLAPCAHHVAPSTEYPACPSSEYSTPSLSACSRPTVPGGIVHWSFLVVELGERNAPLVRTMICCEIQTRRRMAKHNEITDVSALLPTLRGSRGLYSRHKRPESLRTV